MIRIPQVRVVDEEGAQLGVMPTPQALEMAQERGFDLVEVAPMASPPVVKFLDFGQYKYELTKREKEAKRKQRSVTFKEVRLSPKIGVGDFDTKVHRAIEFLEDGDRIKVTVRFRGRELTHPEIGRNLIARFADRVKDHGVPERTPLLEGKSMHITMASTHKPKGHDGPVRPADGADGQVDGAPAPTPSPTPAAAAAGDSRRGRDRATGARRTGGRTEDRTDSTANRPHPRPKPAAAAPKPAAAAKSAAAAKRQPPSRPQQRSHPPRRRRRPTAHRPPSRSRQESEATCRR